MERGRFYFKSIEIIESLRTNDRPTALNLFNEVEPMGIASVPEVIVKRARVATKQAFLDELHRIATEAASHQNGVILHIEAHGDEDGIQTTSRECLDWREFKSELIAINYASRFNLFVILAACKGAHVLQTILPGDRAPVRAVIGPWEDVFAPDLESATIAFYRTLFSAGSAPMALRAMNDAINPSERTFLVRPAHYAFHETMYLYLTAHRTEAGFGASETRFVAQMARDGFVPPEHREEALRRFRSIITDVQGQFDFFRRLFFFLDLQPENESLFPITLEECLRDPSSFEKTFY